MATILAPSVTQSGGSLGGFFGGLATQILASFISAFTLESALLAPRGQDGSSVLRITQIMGSATAEDHETVALDETAAPGANLGTAVWYDIQGLSDTSAMLIQRVTFTYQQTDLAGNGFLFFYAGRPAGAGLSAKTHANGAFNFSPGVHFDFGGFSLQNTLDIAAGLGPFAIFRIVPDDEQIDKNLQLDLTPNYIPARRWWLLWVPDQQNSNMPRGFPKLYGKRVPFRIPDNLFSF